MVEEAGLRQGEHGLVPEGDGWFVLNARDSPWFERTGMRRSCTFEGERFSQLGVNVNVLDPGRPSGMYHSERAQEDFLVVAGECLLLVEGEERRLRAWDFFHCPAGTEHILVGAGSGPCVYVAVGARNGSSRLHYPANELARRHGAGVERDTTSPAEAYVAHPRANQPYRDGDLL